MPWAAGGVSPQCSVFDVMLVMEVSWRDRVRGMFARKVIER